MVYKKIIFIGFIVAVFGCAGGAKKKVVTQLNNVKFKPKVIVIDFDSLQTINVSLVGLGYDGNQVAATMKSAAQGAGQAGLIGSLIGGAIVSNAAKNSAIAEKNKPVESFLSRLESANWSSLLKKHNANSEFIWTDIDSEQVYILKVKPQLNLSVDYRALEMVSLVELRDNAGQVLYQNYFHVHSLPLLKQNQTITYLNQLEDNVVRDIFIRMLSHMNFLIRNEFLVWARSNSETNHQSIKFSNDNKEYFERGDLLDTSNQYITYRSLRGEIKHIPFEIRL
ncbi:hypothetical protein [Pleionea mediterranea]|uniref:Lipoprotein n=1 Tax=Pleionea mediterranea TaxID=523701 RepID=A0A316FZT7_9GAMM|nr:hypothetical protein [Pleionea mediterranea]PWK53902.1 hypothetical protein C8D97_102292 [Pleionea mediterranea]